MPKFPKRLNQKLQKRAEENALRELSASNDLVDFSSNDYLGFARNKTIAETAYELLEEAPHLKNGATGSRLLSGNHELIGHLEDFLAKFYNVDAALVFNSGYDANIGFFSCVPQRTDIILFDELCHASIRDGIQLSHARSFKFKHNDLGDLRDQIERASVGRAASHNDTELYVVTESVFSMDGDSPDLKSMAEFCAEQGYHLIVDEAHATGLFKEGKGLVDQLGTDNKVFARLMTFGKAMGCHGAAWLGSAQLKSYLVNFARSLVYTTALPPHTAASVLGAFKTLQNTMGKEAIKSLERNIDFFKTCVNRMGLNSYFGKSDSAIQVCMVPGNHQTKHLSQEMMTRGFDVRPIVSPTVPEGSERLRICLHAFNTEEEMESVLKSIKSLLK